MVYIAHGEVTLNFVSQICWMNEILFAFDFKLNDGRPVSFRQPASWEEEEEEEEEVQSAAAATQVGFRV